MAYLFKRLGFKGMLIQRGKMLLVLLVLLLLLVLRVLRVCSC